MDDQTIQAYERSPEGYAAEWHDQPPPDDLYDLLGSFFIRGESADIGCGAGRDTAWLNANGFPAVGYDASPGLLEQARARHPEVSFDIAVLPELEGIADGRFVNVLCETVVMHLDPELIGRSVERLLDILQPGGVIYLSWRVTEGADRRDDNGRLYAAFDAAVVTAALAGTTVLFEEEQQSVSSGRTVHRVIAKKAAETAD